MVGSGMYVEVIYGPPGTGKTTDLQRILKEEIANGTPAHKIAYVSYTKEGAEQGKIRAAEQLGSDPDDLPYFRTLHSMAFRSLSLRRGDVIGKADYKAFSETLGMKFTGYYTEDFYHNDDRYLFFDILHRNNPKVAWRYLEGLDTDRLQYVRKNYKSYKKHYGVLDYTDMIEQFCELNQAVPVTVAFVDEAQDLTSLQWRMVWTAFRDCERVYIAGDDDQAIYEWSGADVDYFLRIQGNPRVLHHSYRLPKRILQFAKMISAQIEHRVEKEYSGTKETGDVHRITSVDELDLKNGETWMFLSRNRFFLKEIIQMLRDRGYVYTYRRESSIHKAKMKAIIDYEHVRHNRESEQTRMRSYLRWVPKLDYSRPWFEVFAWEVDELSYYRTVIGAKTDVNDIKVYIDTIHSVKGAEADNVVLLPDVTRQVYQNIQNNPDSEHRVFYVGVTRARHKLFVMDPVSKYEYPLLSLLGG